MLPPRNAPHHWLHAALLGAYLATWAAVAYLPLGRTDLDAFFWPAADVGAAGHPLMVYAPGGRALYPDANGPLSLFPLTAVEWLARSLGWLANDHLHRALTFVVFSLFVLAMAGEALRAVERLRGEQLPEIPRLLVIGALVLAPPVWQSMAGFGHVEQPMETWLILLAARFTEERRPLRAGAALGLAVLARSPAILLGIPLLLAFAGDRAWRRAAALGGAAIGTVTLVMAPLLLADRADVLHSLLYYRGALGVGAGSIWTLARGTALEDAAQHLDLLLAGALALGLNAWLATAPGGLRGTRLFAGLAVAAAAFALLAKTVWPYYFFEVYVFTATWVLSRSRRLLVTSGILAAVIAMGLLAEIGSTTGLPPPQVRREGVAMFLLLASALVAVAIRARHETPGSVDPG